LNVTLAQDWIDGDDYCPEINASKIKHRQFTAVRNHHPDAVTLPRAPAAEFRSQSTGLPVKLAVSNFAAGDCVDQEDLPLAARHDIHDRFADRRFADRHCIAKGLG
jgi:hypothetical protein